MNSSFGSSGIFALSWSNSYTPSGTSSAEPQNYDETGSDLIEGDKGLVRTNDTV